MKIDDNGVVRDMTAEEIAMLQSALDLSDSEAVEP